MTKIPLDKQAHFWWGMAVACPLTVVVGGIWACLAVAVMGLLKEGWDAMGHGTPDPYDSFATFTGGLVGAALMGVLLRA